MSRGKYLGGWASRKMRAYSLFMCIVYMAVRLYKRGLQSQRWLWLHKMVWNEAEVDEVFLPVRGKIQRHSHPIRFCICAWRYSKRPDYVWLWHAEFISMISSSSEYSQELHPPHGMHKDWVSVCQWTTGSDEDSSSFILLRSLACLMVLSTRGDTMPRIVVIFMTWTSV